MSFIGPQSSNDVDRHERARIAQRAGAGQMYGPNLSKWPAREADIAVLLELERGREEYARHQSTHNHE